MPLKKNYVFKRMTKKIFTKGSIFSSNHARFAFLRKVGMLESFPLLLESVPESFPLSFNFVGKRKAESLSGNFWKVEYFPWAYESFDRKRAFVKYQS